MEELNAGLKNDVWGKRRMAGLGSSVSLIGSRDLKACAAVQCLGLAVLTINLRANSFLGCGQLPVTIRNVVRPVDARLKILISFHSLAAKFLAISISAQRLH